MYEQRARYAFVELGNIMRKYAIAQILLGIFSILTVGIIYSLVISFINSSENPFELILSVIAIFIIIIIILSIIIIVYFFKYLSKLKQVSVETNDPKLERSYKMQLWGFLFPILGGVIGSFIIGSSIYLLVNDMMGEINSGYYGMMIAINPLTINQMGMNGNYIPSSFMMIIPGIIFIALFGIIGIILNILGVIAFDDWAKYYPQITNQSPAAYKITKGTEIFKWGYIIQYILPGIGTILYLIGLIQTGNALKEEFGQPFGAVGSQYGSIPTQSIPNPQNISFQSYLPNQDTTTKVVEKRTARFCMYCGTGLEGLSAKFCPTCGKMIE